ncbi:MAG: hypothetical protein ACREHC_03610 [Candidatus Levyibacteriota bacterium]
MKFLVFLLGLRRKNQRKTLAEYQREMMVKVGRQQFEKLKDLGLHIPVALS